MPAARYKEWTTPEGSAKIRQWVADGLSDRQIADKIGVDKTVLSHWRRKYREIAQALYRPMVGQHGELVDKHDAYTGRQRKLTNVETVQNMVDAYIKECKEQDRPLTKPGLALALNVDSETLTRYVGESTTKHAEPEISDLTGKVHLITVGDVLKRAMTAIEADMAERAVARNSAGAMFMLKNWAGYADKQETTVVSEHRETLDDSQLDSRIQALLAKAGGK